MKPGNKKKICVIINPSFAIALLSQLWVYWQVHGWEVHCITSPGQEDHALASSLGIKTHPVHIERYPSPWKDMVSLMRIWWILLWNRFDLVHVSTPKASFLGVLAGRLSFHSRIIYQVHGRAYEHMTGWKRRFMNLCEWLTCHMATVVNPVSFGLESNLSMKD